MRIAEIELATRSSWPALEELECPVGILRYAAGVTRRTNSMTPSSDPNLCPAELIEITEAFFRQKNLPPIVRVIAGSRADNIRLSVLDQRLEDSSYSLASPTRVMTLQLADSGTAASPRQDNYLKRLDPLAWSASWHSLKRLQPALLPVYQAMLIKIMDPACYLLSKDAQGNPVAAGMAVISNGALGVFGIATLASERRKGFAAGLLAELLHWGRQQGARYAYLQVEKANTAAVNLYKKFGFVDRYSYWYREKQ